MMKDIWGVEKYIAFCEMNSFKYRMRAGKEGQPLETDILKAQWYEQQVEELRNEREKSNDIPNNLSHTGVGSDIVGYSTKKNTGRKQSAKG